MKVSPDTELNGWTTEGGKRKDRNMNNVERRNAEKEFYSVKELAAMTNLSERTIQQHLNAGVLAKGTRDESGKWKVSKDEGARYASAMNLRSIEVDDEDDSPCKNCDVSVCPECGGRACNLALVCPSCDRRTDRVSDIAFVCVPCKRLYLFSEEGEMEVWGFKTRKDILALKKELREEFLKDG